MIIFLFWSPHLIADKLATLYHVRNTISREPKETITRAKENGWIPGTAWTAHPFRLERHP